MSSLLVPWPNHIPIWAYVKRQRYHSLTGDQNPRVPRCRPRGPPQISAHETRCGQVALTSVLMVTRIPDSTCLHPCLRPGTSRVHGTGLQVNESVVADETLMVWGGTCYPARDLGTARIPTGVSYSQISEDRILAGPEDGLDYYLNHSCEPNVWMSGLSVTSRHAIPAGSEILIDYALVEGADEYLLPECRCGTDACRGRVTGRDWSLPELQRRYRGHFLPYINERIRST